MIAISDRLAATTSLAVVLSGVLYGAPSFAQSTWTGATNGNFNQASNWRDPAAVPTGTAFFDNSSLTRNLTFSLNTTIGGWTFALDAPSYIFTNANRTITFNGGGIIANGVGVEIINSRTVNFNNTSTAGSTIITNRRNLNFRNSASAGSADITNQRNLNFRNSSNAGTSKITITGGTLNFRNQSSAAGATIQNNSNMRFRTNSSAGASTIINARSLQFLNTSGAGDAQISNSSAGNMQFRGRSRAEGATIINDGSLSFRSRSTAGNADITNNETLEFWNRGDGGRASITNGANGTTDFSRSNGADNNRQLTVGSIAGSGVYYLGRNRVTVGDNNRSTEVFGVISDCGPTGADCGRAPTATEGGSLVKVGTGTITLSGLNAYTRGTAINGGTVSVDENVNLGAADGPLAFDGGTLRTTGSFEMNRATTLSAGGGTFETNGGTTLTQNGVISGDGTLTKQGVGTLTLAGMNAYTGGTAIYAGTLSVFENVNLGDINGPLSLDGGVLRATGSFSMDRATTLNPGGGTFETDGGTVLTHTGVVAGIGGLTKEGAGKQILSGANTFTGPLAVNDGTLEVQGGAAVDDAVAVSVKAQGLFEVDDAETIGSLTGDGTTLLYSDLTAGSNGGSTEYAGNIGGAGALTKEGAGTMTLSGANTFGGDLTVNDGALAVTGGSAVGDDTKVAVNTAGTFTVDDDETIDGLKDGAKGGGNVILGTSKTLTLGNTMDVAFSGGIAGEGELTKQGAATQTLSGANTFTGDLAVEDGTLEVQGGSAVADAVAVTVKAPGIFKVDDTETIGSISGDGTALLNADLTTGGNGDTTNYAGTMIGTGGLTKDGEGTLTLANASTYTGLTTVNDGLLEVNGSIVSAVVVNGGGTLGGTGQVGGVNVAGGGVFAPGNSIGTQTVAGNLMFAAGGIFEVEVDAAGNSDRVIVANVGTVNLTGATLRVLAQNGNYAPSTDYLIIQKDSDGAVTGSFSDITTNFAFLTPSVDYEGGDGNDVVLTLLRSVVPNTGGGGGNDPTFLSFCSVANTRNQCNVAEALDRFPTYNPLFLAVLTQTAEGARQAFNALSGEVHATIAGTLVDDSRYAREAVLGRMIQASHQGRALGHGGPRSTDQRARYDSQAMMLGGAGAYDGKSLVEVPQSPLLAFWTEGYGAWGTFDGDGNAATADRNLGGFISGMDADVWHGWRLGFATGASFSDVSVDQRHSGANTKTYHLGGYVNGDVGGLALRGGGLWAWSEIEASRAVVFPNFFERQKADYNADTGQLFGEVAYPTQMGGVDLEPFAGLAYVSVETEGFRERGGPEASLRTTGFNQHVGYTTLGLRAARTMTWGDMAVTPHVEAAWLHAFDDVTPGATLAFATTGIGFGVDGAQLAEDSAILDAGLDLAFSDRLSAGVSYSGQFADSVSDNAVRGRLTWLF